MNYIKIKEKTIRNSENYHMKKYPMTNLKNSIRNPEISIKNKKKLEKKGGIRKLLEKK